MSGQVSIRISLASNVIIKRKNWWLQWCYEKIIYFWKTKCFDPFDCLHLVWLVAGEDMNHSHANMDAISIDSTCQQPDNYKAVTKRKLFLRRRMKFAWFCLQNYYTALVNKFIFNMVCSVLLCGKCLHWCTLLNHSTKCHCSLKMAAVI